MVQKDYFLGSQHHMTSLKVSHPKPAARERSCARQKFVVPPQVPIFHECRKKPMRPHFFCLGSFGKKVIMEMKLLEKLFLFC